MSEGLTCPPLLDSRDIITMAHGGGGKLSDNLLHNIILPAFNNEYLNPLHDGAFLPASSKSIVMTTDSYVVKPLQFPGGNIGKLAVVGTLNDLAMCGAKPSYLSCSFVLSEGLPIKQFQQIVHSMAQTAQSAQVCIVTGDTKVIERQQEPECIINTTGIGHLHDKALQAHAIEKNDAIILSGDVGRHGLCIMAARHDLGFTPAIETDCHRLWPSIEHLLHLGVDLHCARDLTRGGLTAALVELAHSSKATFKVNSPDVTVNDSVNYASEVLGLDPWQSACEGRFIAFVPRAQKDMVLSALSSFNPQFKPTCIGFVESIHAQAQVLVSNPYGALHVLRKTMGEQLPRIC